MREIKFRAWHSYSDEIVTEENSGLSSVQILDRFSTIMQYTGLKDKNGKEIYEGDIVGGYPHGSVVVKWDKDYACFSCYGLEDNIDYGLFSNELDSCKDEWEVIGNIHENPELLNTKMNT